jgi:hypothetical protein
VRSLQLVPVTILFAGLLAASGCKSAGGGIDGGGSGIIDGSDSSRIDGGGGIDASGSDGSGGVSTTPDAAIVAAPSTVVSDGYVATGPWAGYGFTATDPGAATIIPECGADACNPPFVGNNFCMHGIVTGRIDYTGFAMLGWNVNQDILGGAQLTWAVPDTGGLIVTVENPSDTPLRVQLQGTDPHSSADRWCAPLVSGQFIPWGSLTTNCWTGGKPQNPLTPGTPIQQAAIIVPGLQTDLPFNFCLVDVQIQSGQEGVDAGSDGSDEDGSDGGDDAGYDGGLATPEL